MKKRLLSILLTCFVFGLFLCGCGKGYEIYSTKPLDVSPAVEQGLNLYEYDDLLNEKVTIRQPIMEVLERNLPRIEPEVMSDTYTLPGTEISHTFSDYPGRGHSATLTNFEKYMLLRQACENRDKAQQYAEEGTLKKHPAADLQYGEVPVENNAVRKRIVTDPDYKSSWLTTGLYLPAGEVATVKISGLKAGQRITMTTNLQQTLAWVVGGSESSYYNSVDALLIAESQKENPDYNSVNIPIQSQYNSQNTEIPVQSVNLTFTENREYKIGSCYGGQLHLSCSNTNSPVEIEITGCVETPHFILGVTTEEYFEEYLRNAPGVMCTVDTENGQLVGMSLYIRSVADIVKAAYMWHSNFAINVSLNGRAYNYPNILKFDRHVPAGLAVALSGHDSACPEDWLGSCLDFENFKIRGHWGVLHELGHQHHMTYGHEWGMRGSQEGEVWNNALVSLNYMLTCNMDPRFTGIEHGEVAHPYTTMQSLLNIPQTLEDYNNLNYFQSLSLYVTLMHQFSPQKFVEFLYSYSKQGSYANNSRADFAYRISTIYGLDFREFLNEYYHARITNDLFTLEECTEMDNLVDFVPIACYWANGVGDSESAAKYRLDAGSETEMDFEKYILSTKPFEIIEVTKPNFGKLEHLEGHKYKYIAPTEVVEQDYFEVVCKLANGLYVKLPIRLQFNYNKSFVEVWQGVDTSNLTDAIEYSKQTEPTATAYTTTPGQNNYNSGRRKDYVKIQFNYVATETGAHKFSMKVDDIGMCQIQQGDDIYNITIDKITSSYSDDHYISIKMKKGQVIKITAHLLNSGGGGYLLVGVQKPGATTYSNITQSEMLLPSCGEEDYKKLQTYIWEAKFIVSIKNYSRKTYISKQGWQVLEAPIAASAATNPNVLIDGSYSTNYHTSTGGNKTPFPHNFVVDMGSVQSFNFFEVCVRNNVNSYVRDYQLFTSLDGVEYNLLSEGTLQYSGTVATITFDKINARYFKFVAVTASGNGFTVIAELSTGIMGKVEQAIRPNAKQIFLSDGFKTANESGSVVSNGRGNILLMNFKGTQFNIFANTSLTSGKFEVSIDGKSDVIVDLEQEHAFSKLVYASNTLEDGEHIVEIKTLDDKEVEISYMTLKYGESLLNAANIYKERALGIALAIFCTLFVFAVVFIVLYFTVPSFRKFFDELFKVKHNEQKLDEPKKQASMQQSVKVESKQAEQKTMAPQAKTSSVQAKTSTQKPKAEQKAATKQTTVKLATPQTKTTTTTATAKTQAKSSTKPTQVTKPTPKTSSTAKTTKKR